MYFYEDMKTKTQKIILYASIGMLLVSVISVITTYHIYVDQKPKVHVVNRYIYDTVEVVKVKERINNPSEIDINQNDDQMTINMDAFQAHEFWKKKVQDRIRKIKQIYQRVNWNSSAQKLRFFTNLENSQVAFKKYLEAQVELQYPKADENETWGSSTPLCISSVYINFYKQRYLDLELWEKGSPKGEICGGSSLTQYEIDEMNQKK
jgi:hypothetical protein